VKAALHRRLRGPVRTRVRAWQAAHPLLGAGSEPGPPDWVGLGVQRSGTSWWHGLIEAHPDVDPLGLGAKELHFFDRFWSEEFTGADVDAYAAHFRRRAGHVVGEWTPRYLHDPWTLPLLRRAAPEAKLLVLLRDPVARFRSGLAHAAKLGPVGPDDVADAFQRGCYAPQLRRLLELAPAEQVLVLQFERCVADPAGELARTFAFLGLRPADVAPGAGTNASRATAPVAPGLLAEVRARYRDDAAAAAELVPGAIDPSLWTQL
jgi:hypothetical protein